jgi:hypothetical protein
VDANLTKSTISCVVRKPIPTRLSPHPHRTSLTEGSPRENRLGTAWEFWREVRGGVAKMNVKQKRCALSEAQENFLFIQSQKTTESKREKPKDVPSEGVASTTTEEHEKGSLYSVGQVVEGRWHQEAQDGWCHHRKIFSHSHTVCIQLSGRVCPGSRHRKPHSKLCRWHLCRPGSYPVCQAAVVERKHTCVHATFHTIHSHAKSLKMCCVFQGNITFMRRRSKKCTKAARNTRCVHHKYVHRSEIDGGL